MNDRRRMRFIVLGLALAGIGSVAALYRLIALAIDKVRSGEGFHTYRTVWLVEFSYVGVLVLLAAVVAAAVVASVVWWREERLWRDLERKYGANPDER